jgi:hypothetical protein
MSATAEGARLTEVHRVTVQHIGDVVAQRARAAALTADVANIDAWWLRVGPVIERMTLQGSRATATITARYLIAHAAAEAGLKLSPALYSALAEQVATSLAVTGPVAFKTAIAAMPQGSESAAVQTMATRLSGSASRLTVLGSRNTITGALRDGAISGYRRVGAGKSCAFCSLLIGRGAVYSADGGEFRAHDHDDCSAEPLYRREPEPQSVLDLQEQYAEVTAGKSGASALRAWRAHWDTVSA